MNLCVLGEIDLYSIMQLYKVPFTSAKQEKLHTFACRTGECSWRNTASLHACISASCCLWVIYVFTMATNEPPSLSFSLLRSNEEAPFASQVILSLSISLSLSFSLPVSMSLSLSLCSLSVSHLPPIYHLEMETDRE